MACVAAASGARFFATSAEIAAVHCAVNMVISLNKTGKPEPTSARTPQVISVWRPSPKFFWLPVDVFEAINRTIAGRYEFNDVICGVGSHASRLVELLPAQEITFDAFRKIAKGLLDTGAENDFEQVITTDKWEQVRNGKFP